MTIKKLEAEPMGRCYCGCGAPLPENKFWLPGHDHRAICQAIAEFGSSANLIASLGMAPARRGRKARGAK